MKFLKRFRQDAISNQKSLSYLLYALGEVLLVVIGILIAVYINRGQEEQRNDLLERDFAQELKNSFIESQDRMNYIFGFSQKIYASQEKIINYLNEPEKQALPTKEDWSMFFKISIPTLPDAAYESLKGFGLNHVRNDEVRALLINLYDTTFPAFQEANNHYNNILTHLLEDSGQYLTDWSWVWNKFPTEPIQLDLLKADKAYLFRLKVLKEMNLYNIITLQEILDDMDAIIQGLDKELEEHQNSSP